MKSFGFPVRMVFLTLNASMEFFSERIRRMHPENQAKKPSLPGSHVMDVKGGCTLEDFIPNLKRDGYKLVRVVYDPNKECAHFGFADAEYAKQFKLEADPVLQAELLADLEMAVSQVKFNGIRVHSNPSSGFDGVEVPGERVLAVGAVYPKAMGKGAKRLIIAHETIEVMNS